MLKKKKFFLTILMLMSIFTTVSCSNTTTSKNNGNKENNTPTKITVQQLISSNNSNFAILSDGNIYSWGENSFGQLGLGDIEDKIKPKKINITGSVKQLIKSSYSTFAIMEDSSLYAWGKNTSGQLGLGDNIPSGTPTPYSAVRSPMPTSATTPRRRARSGTCFGPPCGTCSTTRTSPIEHASFEN